MIVIVCGPPHSGKSVFIANLLKQLPTSSTMAIRACPDGEGTWSNNPLTKETSMVRRKGKFTPEFLVETCAIIDNQTADVVLVDVGGIPSKENATIFKRCKESSERKKTSCCFIVVSGDPDEKQTWVEFGESKGCECIALIDTIERGKIDEIIPVEDGIIHGRIAGLSRGSFLRNSKVIKRIVSDLMQRKNDGYEQKKNYGDFQGFLIDGEELGVELGYGETKPEGGVSIIWSQDAVPKLYEYINHNTTEDMTIGIDGVKPNYAISSMCKAAKRNGLTNINIFDVSFNNMVPIIDLPQEEGVKQSGMISFSCIESDTSIFLDLSLPANYHLTLEDYKNCKIPKINPKKKLYISGRIPSWLLCSVVCSYESAQIHTWQPGIGFTCVASNDERDLGKITAVSDVEGIDVKLFFEAQKRDRAQEIISAYEIKEKEDRKKALEYVAKKLGVEVMIENSKSNDVKVDDQVDKLE